MEISSGGGYVQALTFPARQRNGGESYLKKWIREILFEYYLKFVDLYVDQAVWMNDSLFETNLQLIIASSITYPFPKQAIVLMCL